jgi:hypothetical protein
MTPERIGDEPENLRDLGLPFPVSVEPSVALRERALAQIQAHPAASRKERLRTQVVLSVGSWGVALLVFAVEGGVRVTGRSAELMFGTALGTAAIAALAVWAALWRGRFNLGRGTRFVLPLVGAAPAAILLWKVLWSSQFVDALAIWPTRPGFRCLGLSLSIALAPLLAFSIARKGSQPRHPALTGLAAGIAIGCATILLTDLWCPVAYVPHLLLGHALPVALTGLLGALLSLIHI